MSRIARFDYFAPGTVRKATSLLAEHGGKARVLNGGTDLVVKMKKGEEAPTYVISLKKVPGLDHLRKDREGNLHIGAKCTHQAITESKVVKKGYGLLAAACAKIGTPQVRNVSTIAGNLCNASPSADTAPPLLALGSQVRLVSTSGEREVPLDGFFKAPFKTARREDELMAEIIVPASPPRTGGSYQFLTKITAVDETLVSAAAVVTLEAGKSAIKEARIALGSVAPTPIRAKKAEALLKGQAISDSLIEQAAQSAADETNPRTRAEYRRQMSAVLVKRALKEAIAGASK